MFTALHILYQLRVITILSTNILKFKFNKIVGASSKLMEVLNTVARVAKTDAPVLITGESGTGKELIAEALHDNSSRGRESMVKVNLGGISQSLFESEMFGHKKGAFTDAYQDRVGRFTMANKGTIFLDEIGDMDKEIQTSLLRVLEERSQLQQLLSRTMSGGGVGGVQVLIGGEGAMSELSQFSMVLARYGMPGVVTGMLGVLGPMRMPYGRTISTVRYIAGILSDLVTDAVGDEKYG